MTQMRGQWAEQMACDYMISMGMKLIEKNYSCRYGEIDLVMRDDATIIFIEVRYRNSSRFGGALASIDGKKQRRLIATAQDYLQRKRLKDAVRFDVVAIEADHSLEWIANAFDAGSH